MLSDEFNPKAIFPITTIPVATPLIRYEHSSYVELSVIHSHGPFRVPSGILGCPESDVGMSKKQNKTHSFSQVPTIFSFLV